MAPPWTDVLSSAPSGHFLSCSFSPLRLCLLLCCLSLSAGTAHGQNSTLVISALSRPLEVGMLHHADMRTNDLLERSREIKAEDITSKLKQFQSRLRVFTSEFRLKLAELILAIRGGDMEETSLKDLMSYRDASGFSGEEMEQWLNEKETEINVVTNYIKQIRGYSVKSSDTELHSFLMEPSVKDAFVLTFTSLSYEEPYLNKISQAGTLRTGSAISTPEQNQTEEAPWYRRQDIKNAMDSALQSFLHMPSGNKTVSFTPDPKHPGISLRWYHNTVLKDPNMTYAYDVTLDPRTAHKRLYLSSGNRRVTVASKDQYYPYPSDQFTNQYLVLSKEPLTGNSYWEADWSGTYAAVGVAYESMDRKGRILSNDKAWCMKIRSYQSKDYYTAYHNNKYTRLPSPISGSRRLGVYVNREAGTLSFYSVYSNTFTHMHTFNITFTDEPLHVIIYVSTASTMKLR